MNLKNLILLLVSQHPSIIPVMSEMVRSFQSSSDDVISTTLHCGFSSPMKIGMAESRLLDQWGSIPLVKSTKNPGVNNFTSTKKKVRVVGAGLGDCMYLYGILWASNLHNFG